jgi:DNA-binding response OmpR family regulator
VLLTARDREEDRAAGEAAGCDAYLTKPFSPLHLIDVISDVQVAGRSVEGSRPAEKSS